MKEDRIMTVYRPSLFHKRLKPVFGKAIQVGNDLFFSCHDPLLSFRNSPIFYPPGPRKTIYQAVRLTKPLTVEGVNVSDFSPKPRDNIYSRMTTLIDERREKMHTRRTELPMGSLLMREFDCTTKQAIGNWFGMTPRQEKCQNIHHVDMSTLFLRPPSKE
jgi:hypothetical protein